MRFEFVADRRVKVKTFLKGHDISKGLLAKIKYKGGNILVNGIEQNAIYLLDIGDVVTIDIPREEPFEKLEAIPFDLDIIHEDDHFLVLNKPVGFASIPSAIHSNTIANFIKSYYIQKDYEDQQVHIVTRLDRDTSGLMLFAKHGYAHARLDKKLQKRAIEKRYYALVSGQGSLPDQGEIVAPIGRSKDSIVTRAVDPMGKYAKTSYHVVARYAENVHLVDIKLHTGRTHQIRVHFSHIGFPLLGDDFYGGRLDLGITRQALHCHHIAFYDPFTENESIHTINLTDDFDNVIKDLRKNRMRYTKMGIRSLFGSLREKVAGQHVKIVFPEGNDERVVRAAARLKFEGLAEPIILGKADEIRGLLTKLGFADQDYTIINPDDYADFEKMKAEFVEIRKGKATMEDADKLLRYVNYFGVMLVKMGLAEGMVSGACHSTADTVRPALQIIKTKPGISRTSGVFLMNRENTNERYIFADCAINIDPNAQELAEIAVNTAETAAIFDIDPKVAMLSFSTKGSGKAPQVDKVAEATKIAKELNPSLALDGELQFDAAFVPETAAIKAPDSDVAGQANTFVFPDLQSGNIGYKIAQRLGMFDAIGPILQGLNKPVNDLSRGSSADDIYKLGIITAAQALGTLD